MRSQDSTKLAERALLASAAVLASGLRRRVRAASAVVCAAAAGQTEGTEPSEEPVAVWPWGCARSGDRKDRSGPGPEGVSFRGPRPLARGAGAPATVAGAALGGGGGGGGGQDHVGPPLRRRGCGLREHGS